MEYKEVGILDFRKNLYRHIRTLPIKVTAKGKVLFYVLPDKPEEYTQVSTVTPQITPQLSTVDVKKAEQVSTHWLPKGTVEGEAVWEWCQLHWEAVKGKTYPCRVISWEDENGTPIVKEKLACPSCIQKYENKGYGRVYYMGP